MHNSRKSLYLALLGTEFRSVRFVRNSSHSYALYNYEQIT